MMLLEWFLEIALLGSEWILFVLIGLSIVSVAVMVERAIFFLRNETARERLSGKVRDALKAGNLAEAKRVIGAWEGSEAEVLKAGLEGAKRDRVAAEKMVNAALAIEQQRMEQHLSILGTLGNNAPFIGLFGTVLGIIQAFHDLSLDVKGGASAVMSGISEALVATAAGLFVAIPAVIAYNFFMRLTVRALARALATTNTLIAFMPPGDSSEVGQ